MPYLIIDLEMSGTEYGFHDIIQIGVVLADDNLNTIAEFSSLVYPKNEDIFSEEAEEIHGISIFDLEEAELIHILRFKIYIILMIGFEKNYIERRRIN